jgi:hypothetical protein
VYHESLYIAEWKEEEQDADMWYAQLRMRTHQHEQTHIADLHHYHHHSYHDNHHHYYYHDHP